MSEVERLDACPFCGGVANFFVGEHNVVDVRVRCMGCGAEGPLFDDQRSAECYGANLAGAGKHWNTRARTTDSETYATVVVCQGPPRCDLMGDEAVAAAESGCVWCKRIRIDEDGNEMVLEPGRV